MRQLLTFHLQSGSREMGAGAPLCLFSCLSSLSLNTRNPGVHSCIPREHRLINLASGSMSKGIQTKAFQL